MAFSSNNREFESMSDTELANILSYFNPEFIVDIVNDNMQNIYRPYNVDLPNLVNSYEMHFADMMTKFPQAINELVETKNSIYKSIIDTICRHFNLSYKNIEDLGPSDLYGLTNVLYDTFISGFTNNLTVFFAELIIRESDSLYSALNLSDNKKNKDNSNIYSKKVFANPKLASLIANFDLVINNIIYCDITLPNIVSMIYGEYSTPVAYLLNYISDNGDFYKNFLCSYLINPSTMTLAYTTIKIEIQKRAEINNVII